MIRARAPWRGSSEGRSGAGSAPFRRRFAFASIVRSDMSRPTAPVQSGRAACSAGSIVTVSPRAMRPGVTTLR